MHIFRISIWYLLPIVAECVYHNTWSLELHPDAEPQAIAKELGIHYIGKINSLDNHHLYQHNNHPVYSDGHSHNVTHHIRKHRHVEDAVQMTVLKRVKRSVPEFSFNDVYFPKQWYLYDSYNNITGAWRQGVTGKGIVITILDDGIERTHPDLMLNYEPRASTDLNDHDDDPMPRYDITNENKHGTRCAGEVSSVADNEVCGVGAAYHSRIGGIRMLDGVVTDGIEAMAIGHNQDFIDIYSASWGPDDDGKTVDGPGRLTVAAFTKGIESGRNGRGSIFVWASGNGGYSQDNCNCDGYTNSIWTLSIGSTSENGMKPWYAEECSSTLAVTYSSGSRDEKQILSTDLHSKCTEKHTGTSAAAPLAAGIFALVLQANPLLTWRDLQHLVVRTSKPRNLQQPEWTTNGAGYKVSHKFGFGVIDAGGLVELASLWNNVPDQEICNSEVLDQSKVIGNFGSEEFKINFNGCDGKIKYLEHVQCVLTIDADKRGDISIELTSPAGTLSQLLTFRKYDRNTAGFKEWPFLNVHNWGEDPTGVWTLKISNNGGESMKLVSWHLVLYGTSSLPDLRDSRIPIPSSVTETDIECDRQCDPSLGCHGPGPGNCTACIHYLQQSTQLCVDICGPGENLDRKGAACIAHCAAGEFIHSSGQCKECDSLCGNCDGPSPNNCTSCHAGKFLLQSQHTCVDSCPPNTVIDAGKCEPCHSDCLTCTDVGYDKCLTCIPSLFFLSNRCYQSCPPGYYGDNKTGTCKPCHEGCSSCYGSSETECISCSEDLFLAESQCLTSCPQFYYITHPVGPNLSNECKRCHYTCRNCSGDTALECTQCVDGLFLSNGECQQQCPDGYVGNMLSGVCESCHHSCLTCFGSQDYQCSGCNEGFSLVGGKCAPECKNVEHCLSCNSEHICSLCSDTTVLYDGKCHPSCPDGMFNLHGVCKLCDIARHCSKCDVSGNCLSCSTNYTLENGICKSPCPDGQFYYQDTCIACFHKCSACFGPSKNECTACSDDATQSLITQYQLKKQVYCDDCSDGCELCSQPYNNYCLSCSDGKYLLPDKENSERAQCVSDCPVGTFATEENNMKMCSSCHKTCAHCTGTSSSSCTTCSPGLLLQGNSCLPQCSESFFIRGDTCLPCDNSCRTCTGPGIDNCLSCPPGFLLQQQKCVRDCGAGFFKFKRNACEKCHPTCTECNGSNEYQCSQCIEGFTLSTDRCVDSCSQGFYNDRRINTCKPCHVTCHNCTDEGFDRCLACKAPLVKNLKYNECWQCCSESVTEHCCYCSGGDSNYCVERVSSLAQYSFGNGNVRVVAGTVVAILLAAIVVGVIYVVRKKSRSEPSYVLLTSDDNADDEQNEFEHINKVLSVS